MLRLALAPSSKRLSLQDVTCSSLLSHVSIYMVSYGVLICSYSSRATFFQRGHRSCRFAQNASKLSSKSKCNKIVRDTQENLACMILQPSVQGTRYQHGILSFEEYSGKDWSSSPGMSSLSRGSHECDPKHL